MSDTLNPLQKKIGIIGGGQLGKMMILDAKRLGYYVVTPLSVNFLGNYLMICRLE